MNIIISNSSDQPIYEQITSQIKTLIINGELKEGDALPSMRTLAKDLHISIITTKRAYEDLERDGFTKSFTGKGSFVCQQNINLIREESIKKIEHNLLNAITAANTIGLSCEELTDMIKTLYNAE